MKKDRLGITKLVLGVAKQFRDIDEEDLAQMMDYVAAMVYTRNLVAFIAKHQKELHSYNGMANKNQIAVGGVSMRFENSDGLIKMVTDKIMGDDEIPREYRLAALGALITDKEIPDIWRKDLANHAKKVGWF